MGHTRIPRQPLPRGRWRSLAACCPSTPRRSTAGQREERARRFCESTAIFRLAESLGGVESLCEVPAAMTHGSVAGSTLEVSPSLVRLSVGIEHAADLVADISQALDRA